MLQSDLLTGTELHGRALKVSWCRGTGGPSGGGLVVAERPRANTSGLWAIGSQYCVST